MFSSATEENKIVTSDLSVTYKTLLNSGDVPWYKNTRIATKDYKFVNMTRSAASSARFLKQRLYTRNVNRSISDTRTEIYPVTTANIEASRNDCGSWDVHVVVKEEDTKMSLTIPDDYDSLFALENLRSYDEPGDSVLHIEAVEWGMDYRGECLFVYGEYFTEWSLYGSKLQMSESATGSAWEDVLFNMASSLKYKTRYAIEGRYIRLKSTTTEDVSNVVQVPYKEA